MLIKPIAVAVAVVLALIVPEALIANVSTA